MDSLCEQPRNVPKPSCSGVRILNKLCFYRI